LNRQRVLSEIQETFEMPTKKPSRRAAPITVAYTTKYDPMEEIGQRWIDRCSTQLTKIAYSRSLKLWRHFLGGQEEHRIMNIVSENDVIEFRDWLLAKKMKSGVVCQHLDVLSRFYTFAIKNGQYRESNPFLDAPRPKGEALPQPLIEPHEMRRILSAPTAPGEASTRALRDRAILLVLAQLALRVSEVVKLRNRDFIQERVAGRLGEANRILRIENAKHGSSAEIPVIAEVEEAILAYLKADHEMRQGFGDKPDDPLFQPVRPSARQRLGTKVRALSARWIEQLTAHYAVYSGIEKTVSPHSFRRAAITRALDLGATYRQVQNLSRHKSIETVRQYDLRRKTKTESAAFVLSYEETEDT
jgi:integrase/recombinase XerD